ncbi:hypothetical protein M422DRAFT_249228 [Sphaerobolus stellatus SS14]|nr:hypothetical protein M422DRAFT_249228 [Sphaerobolus stellatus SS14]
MAAIDDICDPLSMGITKQWEAIAPLLDEHARARIQNSNSMPAALSDLLHDPRYTVLIASKCRPILMILCARWIDQGDNLDAKLAALAFLINPHEELYLYVLFMFMLEGN